MQHSNTMTPVLNESDCSQDFNLCHRREIAPLGELDVILESSRPCCDKNQRRAVSYSKYRHQGLEKADKFVMPSSLLPCSRFSLYLSAVGKCVTNLLAQLDVGMVNGVEGDNFHFLHVGFAVNCQVFFIAEDVDNLGHEVIAMF